MSSLKSDLLLPSILQNINKIGVLVHSHRFILTVPGKPEVVHRNLNLPSTYSLLQVKQLQDLIFISYANTCASDSNSYRSISVHTVSLDIRYQDLL